MMLQLLEEVYILILLWFHSQRNRMILENGCCLFYQCMYQLGYCKVRRENIYCYFKVDNRDLICLEYLTFQQDHSNLMDHYRYSLEKGQSLRLTGLIQHFEYGVLWAIPLSPDRLKIIQDIELVVQDSFN